MNLKEIKGSKYYRLVRDIVIALLALFAVLMLTHFISKWSADTSSEQEIRIQNLLTMQKDSLKEVYLKEKLDALDSVEVKNKSEVEILSSTNDRLIKKNNNLGKEVDYFRKNYLDNPTLESCDSLVNKQAEKLYSQDTTITSLEKEAQEWCELYENENEKGIIKDTLIAGKTRTVQTLNSEVKTIGKELKTINDKLNTGWWKRNWLWATNSYRNWLRDTR